MARAEVAGSSGIDASEFKGVAQALKAAQPMLRRELIRNLKAAGALVARDAAAIVAPHSESIPPTIKVRQRGLSIWVEAGGIANRRTLARQIFTEGYSTSTSKSRAERTAEEGVPLAGLFELGNKGKRTAGGAFRHPVFGTNTWVSQETHPFLVTAGKRNQAKIDALVYEALDAVAEEIVHGFGGVSAA
jgi:hypothetical protein